MKIFNRRYIGGKRKLLTEIEKAVGKDNSSFMDLFAGTAVVADHFSGKINNIIVNDFLNHNFSLYNAFFSNGEYNAGIIDEYIRVFNNLKFKKNIFSDIYADKWFTASDCSKIWEARSIVEKDFKENKINNREYYILISIIILAADKASRSVGHFESFHRSGNFKKVIFKELTITDVNSNFKIYSMDANELVKKVKADVVYIDPPYNSRQYAYFYHVLETISLFKLNKKTEINGVAAKPGYIYEKNSKYSTSKAFEAFSNLIENIDAKKIVVSYNNTDNPSSSSSKNKLTYDQIKGILKSRGSLTVRKIPHKFFNSGKTNFINHNEYLFILDVKND